MFSRRKNPEKLNRKIYDDNQSQIDCLVEYLLEEIGENIIKVGIRKTKTELWRSMVRSIADCMDHAWGWTMAFSNEKEFCAVMDCVLCFLPWIPDDSYLRESLVSDLSHYHVEYRGKYTSWMVNNVRADSFMYCREENWQNTLRRWDEAAEKERKFSIVGKASKIENRYTEKSNVIIDINSDVMAENIIYHYNELGINDSIRTNSTKLWIFVVKEIADYMSEGDNFFTSSIAMRTGLFNTLAMLPWYGVKEKEEIQHYRDLLIDNHSTKNNKGWYTISNISNDSFSYMQWPEWNKIKKVVGKKIAYRIANPQFYANANQQGFLGKALNYTFHLGAYKIADDIINAYNANSTVCIEGDSTKLWRFTVEEMEKSMQTRKISGDSEENFFELVYDVFAILPWYGNQGKAFLTNYATIIKAHHSISKWFGTTWYVGKTEIHDFDYCKTYGWDVPK